ncbi:rhodanese-related sulfurtransferase [Panacagrimonas perspica]|uniref:Rhodanese-related sulfurtransferase n=1 Tax=Panacagrimonas perspica TaxID=381431 RepID=A0A4S3K5S0_9GAMM|nr:rhodanese-like domain-containing protein [Panacagrimonas perspica]TDU28053.1 rhodanese-related sulfurtransferase [Panacagrimonas perspica]THD03470.1 rhodanese-like domain-containing protein [Panacagrimonas perspica]
MQQFIDFFGNHLALFAAFGTVLLAIVANEVHGNVTGGKRVGPLEAVRMINDREPVIVDLRAMADFKKGHLLNAINIPAAKIEERATEFKDKARPILLYCALGGSSVEAAGKLRKLGFSEAYPIRGGLNGWMQSNLPVTAK